MEIGVVCVGGTVVREKNKMSRNRGRRGNLFCNKAGWLVLVRGLLEREGYTIEARRGSCLVQVPTEMRKDRKRETGGNWPNEK